MFSSLRHFWAQMALAALVAILGPKKVSISGPTPYNGPQNHYVPRHENNRYSNNYYKLNRNTSKSKDLCWKLFASLYNVCLRKIVIRDVVKGIEASSYKFMQNLCLPYLYFSFLVPFFWSDPVIKLGVPPSVYLFPISVFHLPLFLFHSVPYSCVPWLCIYYTWTFDGKWNTILWPV